MGCYECAMFEQIVYPHVIKLWAIYLLYSIQIQVSIYWQNIIKTIAFIWNMLFEKIHEMNHLI